MKKLFVSLIYSFCFATFFYVGCGQKPHGTPNEKLSESTGSETSVIDEDKNVIAEEIIDANTYELPDGVIISLSEAYENGYLTEEDLLSVAYYNQRTRYNEELMGEDYSPKPKNPETLNEKNEEKIVNALKEYVKKEYSEHITVVNYFGKYDDSIIIEYSDARQVIGIAPVEYSVIIGGVKFSRWSPQTTFIIVYKIEK